MTRERADGIGAAGAAIAGTGAAVGAAAAAACCVTPVISTLIVSLLGASGAVALAGLKPYTIYILGASFVALAYGFWALYRRPARCAADGQAVRPRRWIRVVLWAAAGIWFASAIASAVAAA